MNKRTEPGGTPRISEQRSPGGPERIASRSAVLLLLVLLPFALIGCGEEEPVREESKAVPVEVTLLSTESITESITLTGILEAVRAVDIVSVVSGKVERIAAAVGDRVKKGALLVSLQKVVSRENLRRAEAALLAAEAGWEIARDDFGRDSTLHSSGDIADAAFEGSRAARTAAKAERMSAAAARELAARTLRETEIRAPFAGIVSRRLCEIGAYITPGMPVYRLVDIDSLRLRLGVAQSDIGRVVPGTEVTIRVDALGGRVFRAPIRSVAPESDERTHTFPAEVVFANPDGHPLRDGLVVRATIEYGRHVGVITVPREAILRDGDGEYVFVVIDGAAVRRGVRPGPMIDGRTVVETGLEPGDRLVTVGARNLDDGDRVTVEAAPVGGAVGGKSDR